ncbi:TonB-dependent receptor [Parvularcula flava]|uniref:TonB-dependent receptor n=1 Tax=Aquisalinus luteolus TaxID=1566827 RepID=A0A8J3EQ44_9PROT|nr:TonB-dependent receptor [Aquisalinus luteolus]NHK28925.1 TonB-dependent receptor [Aquisalinus luteolus]GGI00839.1 TonB-dependent receptor [Aquisalinus luteolus]
MKKFHWLKGPSAAAIAVAIAAPALPAAAQVDIITVTAQKREENIQDVPISVTALSEEQLDRSGVADIKDLISITPGLMVTSTSSEASTTARIRGIGTVGDNPGLESSVGVVIDGVYRSRNSIAFSDLGEIERVEVLRGPQGTVFGKNTSAGVINVITKAPDYEFGAGAEVTLGNLGLQRYQGYVTGGNEAQTAAFRLFGVIQERDGLMDVETGNGPRTLEESYTSDYSSLRGQLLFEPNDALSIRLIGDWTERTEDCCTGVQVETGPTAAFLLALNGGQPAVMNPADPEERLAYSNRSTAQDITDQGLSAEIDWDLGYGTLTSVTAWRDWNSDVAQDVDFTTVDIAYRNQDDNGASFEVFTQELRLAGSTDNLDWMVGGFYSDEDLERRDALRTGPAYGPYLNLLVSANVLGSGTQIPGILTNSTGPTSTFLGDLIAAGGLSALYPAPLYPTGAGMNGDVYNQTAESFALFTNNTWHINDTSRLTFGLRYTQEDKELVSDFDTISTNGCEFFTQPQAALGGATGAQAFASGAPALAPLFPSIQPFYCLNWTDDRYDDAPYDFERSDEEISGTVKFSKDLSDNVTGYVSYANSFKAGGFNLDRDPLVLDGTNDDTSFRPEKINSYEAGLKSVLAEGTLVANLAAFHQDIEDFQLNSFLGTRFVVENVAEATATGVELDFLWDPGIEGLSITGGGAYIKAEYGEDIDQAVLAGEQMTLSPEFYGNLGVTYETVLAETLNAIFHVEGRYVSDYNTGSDLDAAKYQEGFGIVNGRIVLSPMDSPFSVELWGKNLFDEYYTQVGFDAPLQTGSWNAFLGAQRTYGVTLKADF